MSIQQVYSRFTVDVVPDDLCQCVDARSCLIHLSVLTSVESNISSIKMKKLEICSLLRNFRLIFVKNMAPVTQWLACRCTQFSVIYSLWFWRSNWSQAYTAQLQLYDLLSSNAKVVGSNPTGSKNQRKFLHIEGRRDGTSVCEL